jgi:hypothetical protein
MGIVQSIAFVAGAVVCLLLGLALGRASRDREVNALRRRINFLSGRK